MEKNYKTIADRYNEPFNSNFLIFLDSNSLSGTSETVNKYEQELALYFKSKFALPLSSGGASLLAALYALDIQPNDEVLVTPICPLCTIYPILAFGAIPVFCDTYEDNFSIDIQEIKNKVTTRTKCIIDIPMWGYPINAVALKNTANEYDLPLIFDLAHAHGTLYESRFLSEYADISCFSTHSRKILSTGEGGFLLTNHSNLYERAKSFIQYGYMVGNNFGLNFLISSLQAALGIDRLKKIDENLLKRKSNANYIINNINNTDIKQFNIVDNGTPNYYSLLIKELKQENVSHFIKYLKEHGIPSDIDRYKCKPIYHYEYLKKYKANCPNAEKLITSFTTIPVHPGLTQIELHHIINNINAWSRYL